MCPSTFAPNMCDSVYSGGGGVCLCVCANGSTLTTCSCHHPLRFPSLLPHVAPGNRGRGGGGAGGWIVTICQWPGDQWNWREGGEGGGERGEGVVQG